MRAMADGTDDELALARAETRVLADQLRQARADLHRLGIADQNRALLQAGDPRALDALQSAFFVAEASGADLVLARSALALLHATTERLDLERAEEWSRPLGPGAGARRRAPRLPPHRPRRGPPRRRSERRSPNPPRARPRPP